MRVVFSLFNVRVLLVTWNTQKSMRLTVAGIDSEDRDLPLKINVIAENRSTPTYSTISQTFVAERFNIVSRYTCLHPALCTADHLNAADGVVVCVEDPCDNRGFRGSRTS